ncbi:MAG: hypothetical protein ACU0CA_07040 [Paracoccaceae bacterium]
MADKAKADVHNLSCIERPNPPTSLGRTPAKIIGLGPEISIPVEGFLKLHIDNSDDSKWLSPTGDFTFTAGPYDPNSKRLYLWGYFANG